MIDINNHMMCFPQMSLLPGLYWNICLMEISNHFSWSVDIGFTLASVACDINLQLRMKSWHHDITMGYCSEWQCNCVKLFPHRKTSVQWSCWWSTWLTLLWGCTIFLRGGLCTGWVTLAGGEGRRMWMCDHVSIVGTQVRQLMEKNLKYGRGDILVTLSNLHKCSGVI